MSIILPACHPYILKNNHSDYVKIVSVSYNAYQSKYKTAPKLMQLVTELKAANLIPQDLEIKQEAIDTRSTCFSIIKDCRCSFICHCCGYSPLFKNKFADEESQILSFALHNWTNLSIVKKHMHSKDFNALLVLQNNCKIPTIPLNRLIFEYLELVSDDTNFEQLPLEISDTLDMQNGDKFNKEDLIYVKKYINNLRSFSKISEDTIINIFDTIFSVSPADKPVSAPTKTTDESSNQEEALQEGEEIITGFLDTKKLTTDITPLHKKMSKTNNVAASMKSTAEITFADMELREKAATNRATTPVSEKTTLEKNKLICAPHTFNFLQSSGCSVIKLVETDTDAVTLNNFLSDILLSPKLPVEIVTDTISAVEYLLLYAHNNFYYFSTKSSFLIDLISPYLKKSSYRSILCFDPYRVLHFFQNNQIDIESVFSIRTFYSVLAKLQKRNPNKPVLDVIKELTSLENIEALQFFLFAMPLYEKMYLVLNSNKLSEKEIEQVNNNMLLNSVLGISYELSDRVENADSYLFDYSSTNLHFYYDAQKHIMKKGYYSITYHIKSKKGLSSLITDLLMRFGQQNLTRQYSYRLLKYTSNSFTLSTTEQDYPYLCDFVNNLVCYLAQNKALVPIHIDENHNLKNNSETETLKN